MDINEFFSPLKQSLSALYRYRLHLFFSLSQTPSVQHSLKKVFAPSELTSAPVTKAQTDEVKLQEKKTDYKM